MLAMGANKTFNFGRLTAAIATPIVQTVKPVPNAFTHITAMIYTAGATAHLPVIMRSFGKSTLSAAAASGQAVIAITADAGLAYTGPGTGPGAVAANDYLVIKKPDGSFHTALVSSGTIAALTLSANVPTGGFAILADVWFMGAPADHPDAIFTGTASVTRPYQDDVGGIRGSLGKYEPMLVYSANATAAGVLEQVSGVYSKETSCI